MLADRFFESGSVRLAIREEGAGPDVLLLPGGGRTIEDFAMVTPLLEQDFRLVSMDFHGHGASSFVEEYSLERAVEDVRAVVEGLALTRPILVGHSLGGMVAAMYAVRYGGVRAVVNADGHGTGHPDQYDGIDRDEAIAAGEALAERGMAETAALVDEGDDDWRRAAVEQEAELNATMGMPPELARVAAERSIQPTTPGRWRMNPHVGMMPSFFRELRHLEMMPVYRALQCRTAIVTTRLPQQQLDDPEFGKYARAYATGLARELAEVAAANPLVTIHPMQTGHMVTIEAPAAVAELVRVVA